MLQLRQLRIKHFRGFENAQIDFPEKGLWLIEGKNLDTGDSSDSSKSTVLLAIAYAFDILPPGFSGSSLQNWNFKDSMQVELDIETQDGLVTIGKGKKTFVKYNETLVTGSKPVAESILKIVGVSPEILSALTYRYQKSDGLFLSKKPAEKAEFLIPVLGLDKIEEAADQAKEKAKVLGNQIEIFDSEIKGLKSALPTLESIVNREYESVDVKKLEESLSATSKLMQETSTALDIQKNKLKEEESKAESDETLLLMDNLSVALKMKEQLKKENEEKRKTVESSKNEILQKIKPLDLEIANFPRLSKEREKLASELNAALDGKCPTCIRTWDESIKLAETLAEKIKTIEAQLGKEEPTRLEREHFQGLLKELVFIPDERIEKFEQIEKKLQEDIRQAKMQKISAVRSIEKTINEIQMTLNEQSMLKKKAELAIENEIKNKNKEKIEKEATLNKINSIKSKISELEEKISQLTYQKNEELDFASAVGREGFLGAIFAEVLDEIAYEANARLSRTANVANVSVSFSTETSTEKGKIKRNIKTNVFVNGKEATFESGISGGQQTSVEQAVDFGLMTVLQRRSGRVPGWLCLDEIFTGQGRVSKETALDIIKEMSQSKLVMVIDHSSEFKELFDKTLKIERKNGISRVVG